jgi:hypothetical protein
MRSYDTPRYVRPRRDAKPSWPATAPPSRPIGAPGNGLAMTTNRMAMHSRWS